MNDQEFEVTIFIQNMGEDKKPSEILTLIKKSFDTLPDDIDFGNISVALVDAE